MDDWNLDRLGEESGDEDEGADVTWSFSGSTGTVFLIDAAKEMFDSLPGEEDEDTPFTRAIKAVHASMMRKAIAKPYDLMAVVFFNTREAKNPLGYSGDSQFETKFGHSVSASIHDSLRTCQSVFNTSEKRHSGRSILLFTCRDNPHAGDDQRRRQAVTKAKDLKESAIALEILHMGVAFDVDKFYKDLILPDDTEEEEEQGGELTRERRTLADPTTRFEELMKRVSLLENKQRVAGKLVFTLAPGVTVGVGIYSVVKKSRKPTKKRLWKNTNQELKSIHKDYLMDTGELVSRSDYEYYQKFGNRKIGLTMSKPFSVVLVPAVPNNEQMEKRAGPQLREFDRLVFTNTVSQSAKIQSATSALLASKRVKIDNDNLDVETMVRRGQAQQLTVPVLKSWLTARGMSITGKKKAELMQAVIDAVCA
ncbi:X-ray repair cross-complementing protein 6 [Portunus trituberculatus]|uniref:X-ray repair cross-complementing protein 6 n=1 Tax=Portunus trituberculatus TaxID=210409 RepID=A0A5B7CPX4_PORTR|nr:X-ray repair cross-complementing protein 6 [Portunus trituberculatus]